MVVYLYRWKVNPEKEDQFIKAWSYITEQLREKCGSMGSRLHKGSDGIWYGYAQWPFAEKRDQAKLNHSEIEEARKLLRDASPEPPTETMLTPVSDFLIHP